MKRKLASLSAALALTFALSPALAAAASSDLLFGQQHNYTVTMRGNGEAVVLARLVFTNTADQPQTTFSFTIPGNSAPSDLAGYQQQYQSVCNEYGGGSPLKAPASVNGTNIAVPPTILPCLLYSTPDYTQTTDNQDVKYQKLTFTSQGSNQFQVKLPTPVPSQQTSSLLISYSTMAYAHRSLGAYSFKFQTIKVNQRVASTNVAVDVDSGQYLQGSSTVNYQPAPNTSTIAQGAAAPNATALNQISDNLGSGGQIDKTASDLAPGDTLTVKGRYASSLFLLHLPALLATAGFLVLVVVVALVFWRRIAEHLRRHRKPAPHSAPVASAAPGSAPDARPPMQVVNAGNVLAGLVSAAGVAGVVWFMAWYQQSSSYNSGDNVTGGLVLITVFLAVALCALGPAVYLAASSRDWRRLVFAIAFEILFLVAFVVIYAIAIAPLFNSPNQPTPVIYPGAGIQN